MIKVISIAKTLVQIKLGKNPISKKKKITWWFLGQVTRNKDEKYLIKTRWLDIFQYI